MDQRACDRVILALAGVRLDLSDEKATQTGVAALLEGAGLSFVREARLSGRDIVDFLVGVLSFQRMKAFPPRAYPRGRPRAQPERPKALAGEVVILASHRRSRRVRSPRSITNA